MKANETIRVAVNSLESGIINKDAAINMLENVISCKECNTKKILFMALGVIEHHLYDEIEYKNAITKGYPLDLMSIEDLVMLNKQNGLVFDCEDGHVVSMYKKRDILNEMEVIEYGKAKRVACI